MLSKSQFIRGLQCHKSLWLYKHRPDLREQPDAAQQAIFDGGTDVGVLVQDLFPGGVLVPYEGLSFSEQVKRTRQALADGVQTIYEATFRHDDVFVKVDILHRGRSGWELYEVKASTGCKEVYLNDIAVQMRTALGAGCKIKRAFLVHLNSGYVRGASLDVHQLFTLLDVTDEVKKRQQSISAELAGQKAMVGAAEPLIDIGPQCSDPYPCDFQEHCWAHIPENSVFDLAGRGRPNPFALYAEGILCLKDIPRDRLKPQQQLQWDGQVHQRNHLDVPAVKAFLKNLEYPLSFLDFETTGMGMPVPLFEGTRSYQQVPFQFSLHVIKRRRGRLHHQAFLCDKTKKPQKDFLEALLAALPEQGSILTWNARFEVTRLKELAERFPRKKRTIEAVIDRIVDLMGPFERKEIYHWQFDGSYSIKKVLPALVPDLSYEGMEIADGGEAAQQWVRLQHLEDEAEAERIRARLLEYCRLDTLAMVRILERMREAVQVGVL